MFLASKGDWNEKVSRSFKYLSCFERKKVATLKLLIHPSHYCLKVANGINRRIERKYVNLNPSLNISQGQNPQHSKFDSARHERENTVRTPYINPRVKNQCKWVIHCLSRRLTNNHLIRPTANSVFSRQERKPFEYIYPLVRL